MHVLPPRQSPLHESAQVPVQVLPLRQLNEQPPPVQLSHVQDLPAAQLQFEPAQAQSGPGHGEALAPQSRARMQRASNVSFFQMG